MSIKRQATSDLNHENWDQEDPAEHEEMGSFKTASKEILEKRVIRTAKRRSHIQSGEEPKKGVFSGFGGFNKPPPASFEFLANLTNGNKPTNGSPVASTNLFSNLSSSPSGVFNATVSSPSTKPAFGITNSQSSLFGDSKPSIASATALFSSKSSSEQESPFKLPVSTSLSPSTGNSVTFAKNNSPTQEASDTNSKVPFSTSPNLSPFKIQTTNTALGINSTPKSIIPVASSKTEEKNDEKKLKYYAKLKGLNECVSDWIKKHTEETPLCILSPIFKDYEKYLKEIQEEYHGSNKNEKPVINEPSLGSTQAGSSVVNKPFGSFDNKSKSPFDKQIATQEQKSSFSLGNQPSAAVTTAPTGFSFGISASSVTTTSPPFSFATNTTTENKPFSFGTGKPFSFAPNTQVSASEEKADENEEDEPPKVEYTPVVEENSVLDKKCKIFVKKDGNFVDKGVGTLYIKKIENSGKHQLLVRANTNLGTVLVNLVLASGIPTQRMGKNNVMMVCIPTPDSKPPPTPILIRVKTSEEADNLLETLNKYKN